MLQNKFFHWIVLIVTIGFIVGFTSKKSKISKPAKYNKTVALSTPSDSTKTAGFPRMTVEYFLENYSKPKNEIWVCYFWATWCMNCSRTHKILTQLDNQFKQSNVRVVSLSMDKSQKKWETFLNENGSTWEQVYAYGMRFDKKFVKAFGQITSLPQCFIIARTGEASRVKLLNQLRDEIMKAIENQ